MAHLFDIVSVRDHSRTRDGLEVAFWNGLRVALARQTPDFDYFEFLIRQAEEVGREGKLAWAVGIEVELPDELLVVGHATHSPVMGMHPGSEPGEEVPCIAGHPFALCLRATHPEYARIHRTLAGALESGAWVWYALYDRRGHNQIMDARLCEEVLLPGGVPLRCR